MLAQGLSHVILNASCTEKFDAAIKFYEVFGFQIVSDKSENDQRTAWLKLTAEADIASDATIQLTQNVSTFHKPQPAGDIDWSLEERTIVFYAHDMDVCKNLKFFFWSLYLTLIFILFLFLI
jgi:hypothetical protein